MLLCICVPVSVCLFVWMWVWVWLGVHLCVFTFSCMFLYVPVCSCVCGCGCIYVQCVSIPRPPTSTGNNRADKNEILKVGEMANSVYVEYFTSMGWCLFLSCVLTIAIGYACMVFVDVWLTMWISEDQGMENQSFHLGGGHCLHPLVS